MKYADRNGKIIEEETGQDRLLRFLYEERAGRSLLSVLTRPAISKAAGAFLGSRLSSWLVGPFIRKNHIDMSDYEKKAYRSYNDFFTRRIKPGRRPIDPDGDALISPCDGKVTICPIDGDSRLTIKGISYTTASLLKNPSLAGRFAGGTAVIIRLTVDNYHHYCYAASGIKSFNVKVGGIYHTVNPTAAALMPIYRENAREYCLIRTPHFGTLLQMEVGAMMVGKITNRHVGRMLVEKGDEKGYFEFGGSTVILLLQKDRAALDPVLVSNTKKGCETLVRMGERLGKLL